jgi:hypothetical protein
MSRARLSGNATFAWRMFARSGQALERGAGGLVLGDLDPREL